MIDTQMGHERLDLVALGEVMLRLDPGEQRIHTARSFTAWEGGGEYNVARGLRRCFRKSTAIVTALADNPVGRLIEDLMLQGGVRTDWVKWVKYDGIGRSVRNGLNFTERGFGIRGALGCSDRGWSAASGLQPGHVNWDELFGEGRVRWFHTGGIFAALSESTAASVIEAASVARRHGVTVSYDLNYRPSLWESQGGFERAQEVNREIVQHVDVLFGNEEDFSAALGFEVPGLDRGLTTLDPVNFRRMIGDVVARYPHLGVVATTLRRVHTATRNDWGAVLWANGEFAEATPRPGLEILDRVGGGDSFAAGVIFALLEGLDPSEAVEYGAAHGALAMTTPGDTSSATLEEVRRLMRGATPRVMR